MSPVEAVYWSVPGWVVFWGLFAVALVLFGWRCYRLILPLRLARPEESPGSGRIRAVLAEVLLQRCNIRSVGWSDRAGIGHSLMFWGFGLFLAGYVLLIGLGDGLGVALLRRGSDFEAVYGTILDLAGVLVLAAVGWAAVRRYVVRPLRLKPSKEAGVILLLVFVLMVLHYLVEGFGHVAADAGSAWPPIGAGLGEAARGLGVSGEAARAAFLWAWWLHYGVILGFLVYIPRSKHLHVLASPANLLLGPKDGSMALTPVDLERTESFGASGILDFTWKQLLDLYACAECGRCSESCPARLGSPLSPRELIANLRSRLIRDGGRSDAGPTPLVGSGVTEEEIWACTTCGACQQVCPVGVEHVAKVVDLRRRLVFEGKLDAGHERALGRTLDDYNPWGIPWSGRSQWALGLDVEEAREGKRYDYLYWVGCTASADSRVREVARGVVSVLKRAGFSVAILGNGEMCCGDPARRVGDEGLFQRLAAGNIEAIAGVEASAVVTHCPHCMHVLNEDYAQLGARFQVVHHTQVLSDLLERGKVEMLRVNRRVVYHDPCYLGRYQGVFDQPRRILQQVPGAEVFEMKRTREASFCCGAGGGSMWREDVRSSELIASHRLEEAGELGAEVIVTACPFCLNMLSSVAESGQGSRVQVKDIVEMVDTSSK